MAAGASGHFRRCSWPENQARGLEKLFAGLHIGDPRNPTVAVGLNPSHVSLDDDSEVARRLSARNRGHRRRVLGIDVASPSFAETVIHTAGAILIRLAIDRRGARKWCPLERPSRVHTVEKTGPPQGRHRIGPATGSFERVAAPVNHATNVSRLTRDPDLLLDTVV